MTIQKRLNSSCQKKSAKYFKTWRSPTRSTTLDSMDAYSRFLDQLLAQFTARLGIDDFVHGLMRDLKLGMMRKHSLQCAADLLGRPLVSQHVDDHLMEVSPVLSTNSTNLRRGRHSERAERAAGPPAASAS